MIARIWRGVTSAEQAEEYLAYLMETGLKDYRAVPGNRFPLSLVENREMPLTVFPTR